MFLYKFETISEYVLDNIKNNRIYLNSCNLLNDMFEGTVNIEVDRSIEKEFGDFYYNNFFSESETKRIKRDSVCCSAFKEMLAKDCYYSIQNQIGMACFTTRLENHTMWGNYANNFKGICLEFDTTKAPFNRAKKITYSSKPYNMQFEHINNISKEYIVKKFENAILYKHTDWKYEDEYRITGEQGTFLEYDSCALNAIYFGPRADTPSEEYKKLYDSIKHLNATSRYIFGTVIDEYNLKPISISRR